VESKKLSWRARALARKGGGGRWRASEGRKNVRDSTELSMRLSLNQRFCTHYVHVQRCQFHPALTQEVPTL
jgi:hypothetical protein